MNLFLVDLDNTLYSKDTGVFERINARIDLYMERYLNIPHEEVQPLRNAYKIKFKSTLLGLMKDYQIDPFHFLDYVHDIDINGLLMPNIKLKEKLKAIDAKKIIFTNAPRKHAESVISTMNLKGIFDDIIDIVSTDFLGKPYMQTYARIKETYNANRYAMADDVEANLLPAKKLGMTSIFISDNPSPIADITIKRLEEIEPEFIRATFP